MLGNVRVDKQSWCGVRPPCCRTGDKLFATICISTAGQVCPGVGGSGIGTVENTFGLVCHSLIEGSLLFAFTVHRWAHTRERFLFVWVFAAMGEVLTNHCCMHHTVPRSRRGRHGWQVRLYGQCTRLSTHQHGASGGRNELGNASGSGDWQSAKRRRADHLPNCSSHTCCSVPTNTFLQLLLWIFPLCGSREMVMFHFIR